MADDEDAGGSLYTEQSTLGQLFRRDAVERIVSHERWISPDTANKCGIRGLADYVSLGYLLGRSDLLPEIQRQRIISAALWGVHMSGPNDLERVSRMPMAFAPIAAKVAAQLKIPLSSATLLSFALFEEGSAFEEDVGKIVLCASPTTSRKFLSRLPNSNGRSTGDYPNMAPFKALADICQSDLKMVREMMGDATAETKAMATPTPRAMSHTLPSDMEAPFMRPLETRLPQRAGECWSATSEPVTVKREWHYKAQKLAEHNL